MANLIKQHQNTHDLLDTVIKKLTTTAVDIDDNEKAAIAKAATKVHEDIAMSSMHIKETIEKTFTPIDTAMKNLSTAFAKKHYEEKSDKTDKIIQQFANKIEMKPICN